MRRTSIVINCDLWQIVVWWLTISLKILAWLTTLYNCFLLHLSQDTGTTSIWLKLINFVYKSQLTSTKLMCCVMKYASLCRTSICWFDNSWRKLYKAVRRTRTDVCMLHDFCVIQISSIIKTRHIVLVNTRHSFNVCTTSHHLSVMTCCRVWLANRGRLLLRTPGPVPFGTCICTNVETILSWTCHIYGPFEFRTSLGTSILLISKTNRKK